MLTLDQAAHRVGLIWIGRTLQVLYRRADGAFDVQLAPLPLGVQRPDDNRERHFCIHELDADGAVVCHDDCRRLDPGISR